MTVLEIRTDQHNIFLGQLVNRHVFLNSIVGTGDNDTENHSRKENENIVKFGGAVAVHPRSNAECRYYMNWFSKRELHMHPSSLPSTVPKVMSMVQ